jgi:hypothetical protein
MAKLWIGWNRLPKSSIARDAPSFLPVLLIGVNFSSQDLTNAVTGNCPGLEATFAFPWRQDVL